MRCAALRIPIRQAVASQRRSFVSTVLLTKAWEGETVNELRKEARKRGLSASGNKATLVLRIQQDEKIRAFIPEPVSHAPQVRHASTAPANETKTEVPGIPSTAEPTHPKYNLDISIPNTSQPEPELLVQIPFVPDLWESSKLKHESAPPAPALSAGPKVVVVGGEGTHPGGGPSHNLYSPSPSSSASHEPEPQTEPVSIIGRLIADMAGDLGIPTTFKRPAPAEVQYDISAKTETLGGQDKSYSRTLDADERTGLWVLLGVFAGSWVAASVLAPSSEWAHYTEEVAQEVEEKTTGKKH